MVLCTLKVTISALECSEFTFSSTNIKVDEVHMPVKDVCAGITTLFE